MNKHILPILLCALCTLFTACNGVLIPRAANADLPRAEQLSFSAEGRTVTLSWKLADPEAVTAVQIDCEGANPVKIEGALTQYVVRHVQPNRDIHYTVKLCYGDLVSEGRTIVVRIRYDQPIYYGYVLSAPTIEELPDDDEIAAAIWFRDNYVNQGIGRFIKLEDVPYIDLDEVSTLWVHIDRQGMPVGWRSLTGGFSTPTFVAGLRHFVEEGGNVLLTVHATQLLAAIGRIPESLAPNQVSTGEGGLADLWTMNAFIGETYDHRTDPHFADLILGYYNDYEYTSYPMVDAGLHEDHNSMWNLSDMSFSGGDKIRGFELATDATVLATWGQNTEMNYPGLVDFRISGTYRGRIIAMGLGCYEWHKDGGNAWQSQIENLTRNFLTLLHE